MDTDSDSASVKGSRVNYNIRSVSDDGNDQNATYLIKGNEKIFDVPAPVAQNIRIRILRTDESVATGYTATVIFSPSVNFSLTFDWATLRADIEADLDASIGGFTVTTFFSNASYYDINIAYNVGTGLPMSFIAGTGLVITTLLEPVSDQLTGLYYCIGSYDLLLNLFLFLTNKPGQTRLCGNVTAITHGGTGKETVTIVGHGLSTGDYVLLKDLGGVVNLNNQIYWVRRITADTFEIIVSYTGAYTSGGTGTTDVVGVSEIGVALRDSQTEDWTYTMLMRSTKIVWDRAHCIDVDGQFENNQYSLYYSDDQDKIRLFYYIGNFTEGGAFRLYGSFDRPQGLYSLDTIDQQTSLIPAFARESVELVQQDVIGGSLFSGNHVYAYRLLGENRVAATEWTYLSRPVEVFEAANDDYAQLLGGATGQQTSKVNVMRVTFTDIVPSVFRYIQWVYVRYEGDTFTGGILPSEPLQADETTYTLYHTGDETTEPLDVAELNAQRASYDTAKNIRILDNRLVISNIRSFYNNIDLSDYLSEVTHTVEKKTFDGLANNGGGNIINATSYVNMYQKVENTFYFTGYMQHETYDIYLAPEYFNGHIGQPQHYAEVTFEPDAATSFTDYKISSDFLAGNAVSVYVPYFNIVLPAGSLLVDGKTVSSFIKRFHIYRAVRTRPSILGNGILVIGVEGAEADDFAATLGTPDPGLYYFANRDASLNNVAGEFPYPAGITGAELWGGSAIVPIPYPGTGGGVSDFVSIRKYMSFYSADDRVNYPVISPQTIDARAGDVVLNHGLMDSVVQTFAGSGTLKNHTTDFSGVSTDIANPPDQLTVEEGNTARENIFVIAGKTWSRNLYTYYTTGIIALQSIYYGSPTCVLKTTQDADPIDGTKTDVALYMAYYKRPVTNQYNRTTDQLIPTGTQLEINEVSPAASDVFGGDVFTQETFLQLRSVEDSNIGNGLGAGVRYFSQNTHNWQMRNNNEDANTYQYPVMPIGFQTVEKWLENARHQLFYQNGYDIKNPINVLRPFDPTVNYDTDLRATIAWSQLRPAGSGVDSFRIFLPLDIKSLDRRNGVITHHEVLNGELYTVQERNMMRQFFNSTGQLVSNNTAQILIGSGTVLQQNAITITTYGSKNKWGIKKGRSRGGNDVLYVPDRDNKIHWRFGADGLQPISVQHLIHSFFKYQLKWLNGDAPVDSNGLTAVWNEQHSELILTSRVRRNLNYEYWDAGVDYAVGTIVLYPDPTVFDDFDFNANRLFRCLNPINADISPESDPLIWYRIPLDDTQYYNLFTLVYSEKEDVYKTLLSPHALFYITYANTYITQNPYSLGFYLNDTGLPGVWWDDDTDILAADGYYTPVFNYAPSDMKQMENLQIRSTVSPFHVEITTENQQTYMVANDFEQADELGYVAPIPNDSTVSSENPSGLNNLDTDAIYGRIIDPVKIFFQSGIVQKINSIILKIAMRFPTINKK